MSKMKFELKDFFDLDSCQRCGKCLMECPVLKYPEEKAKQEKEKLILGKESEVLKYCKSCYSCERFCPYNAHPYGLILYRLWERYQKQGIPVRALGALPVEEKNFLYYARRAYSQSEQVLVEQWEKNARSELSGEEVIFAGCNAQIFPYLLSSPLLQGVKVIAEPGLCCGEEYYRMGVFDRTYQLGKKLEERYKLIKPGRVIMFCMAGYNMQKNVLPKQFGIKLDFEIVYLGEWLLEKVKSGEIKFTRPLNQKVVLQESCHGKFLGEEFMEIPRQLLRLAGAELVEMNPCRERQVCCGAADGITRFSPLDMLLGSLRQWRLARASGADLFVPYCATCYMMLKIGAKFRPSFLPCLHLLEVLTYCAGYPVESLADKRAGKILMGVMSSSAPRLLSKKRVRFS